MHSYLVGGLRAEEDDAHKPEAEEDQDQPEAPSVAQRVALDDVAIHAVGAMVPR